MAAGPTVPNNNNNNNASTNNNTWALLPSILVVDILSYLSLEDRIRASTVCKRWRCCLFHPSLWPRLVLELTPAVRRQRSKFLAARCGRFVRQIEIVFNSHNISQVKDCLKLLYVVATNKNTQCFTLRPSGCQIEWPSVANIANNSSTTNSSNNTTTTNNNNNTSDDNDDVVVVDEDDDDDVVDDDNDADTTDTTTSTPTTTATTTTTTCNNNNSSNNHHHHHRHHHHHHQQHYQHHNNNNNSTSSNNTNNNNIFSKTTTVGADGSQTSDNGNNSSDEGSDSRVSSPTHHSSEAPIHTIDQYLDNIEALIKTSRHLQHFALGCVEELLEHSNVFVNLLAEHHASTLESLHLASVKEDSESYGIIELNALDFCRFMGLRSLSLDYDYLTNNLLQTFIDPKKSKLENLVINVHGIDADHEVITNETWRRLRNHSPNLEVTLNLIHSFEGVAGLLNILQPSMPLAKFRQMFCSNINIASVSYISSHYNNTLKEIHIIDGFANGDPIVYEIEADEDPFVMLAWRCPKLMHFTLIGYQVCDDDMVAIARLRGQQLKTFDIPSSCIYSLHEEDEVTWMKFGSYDGEFFQKVSESLGHDWLPLKNSQLPAAVLDAQADAEPAYMHILLEDQSWKGRNKR